jgi:hypothetical protein
MLFLFTSDLVLHIIFNEYVYICILQRCIVVDHATDRRTLIELAYRFLMPLPQRKYRANRRGSIMTQNQEQRHAELKELGVNTDVAHGVLSYTMYDTHIFAIFTASFEL